MIAALRAYGQAAARQVLATGVQVRIWDLGSEIEFGVAGVAVRPVPGSCDDTAGGRNWYRAPDAVDPAIGKMTLQALMQMPEDRRAAWLAGHVWPYEAKMLAAVASGIRSVAPKSRFSTHVNGIASTQPAFAVAFFKAMNLDGSSGSFVTRSTAPQLHRLGNAGGLAAGFLAHPFPASRRCFQLLRSFTIWVRTALLAGPCICTRMADSGVGNCRFWDKSGWIPRR